MAEANVSYRRSRSAGDFGTFYVQLPGDKRTYEVCANFIHLDKAPVQYRMLSGMAPDLANATKTVQVHDALRKAGVIAKHQAIMTANPEHPEPFRFYDPIHVTT